MKTLEELWFSPSSNIGDSTAQSNQGMSTQSDRLRLLARVTVIMTVCGNFKDRQSPLDDVLHKIVSLKEGAEANALLARYGEVLDVMIDGLVDASDFPGFVSRNVVVRRRLLKSPEYCELHTDDPLVRRCISANHNQRKSFDAVAVSQEPYYGAHI